MTSSAVVLIGYFKSLMYFWAKVTDILHAAVKEEKEVFRRRFLSKKQTNLKAKLQADSQLTVLLSPPPPPSFLTRWSILLRLLQECDRVEDALFFLFFFYQTMLTQGNMSRSFVKLLVLCDQLWLSHWTCLPLKPDPVVRFSLKWKGNTVCLPRA